MTKTTENSPFIIEIDENARITYINQKLGLSWPEWKKVSECNSKELSEANLATPHPKYILLDKDFKDKMTKSEILSEFNIIKNKLLKHSITNYIADYSRNGFHIFIPTINLHKIKDVEVQNEIRNIFISEFNCDIAKKSANTVISLPGRPHFKTNIVEGLIEKGKGEEYTIKDSLINIATERVKERTKILHKLEIDKDFEKYFESDVFWKYLSSNIIPEHTNRDIVIFPNLAIAAAKSGKSEVDIKKLVEPIIKKNFPGKKYAEFNGWLKKAFKGEITDYNFIQINKWMETFANDDSSKMQIQLPIYNTSVSLQDELVPTKVEDIKDEKEDKFKIYWDKDFKEIKNQKTEWLIENWIPKGDICFMAGKSASFKSTIALHMGYAIADDKLVFNKYKVMPGNVLYLNEENSSNIILSMISRVKKGLNINKPKNKFGLSILENIRMDNSEHLYFLIDFINKNKIDVLFVDSFARFMSFDENNATEMNKMFNNWKIFRKLCNNLTIISLHHHKKSNGKFAGDARDMLRGSSDIVNNADSIIVIDRKKGSKYVKMSHVKNRSGEEMEKKLIIIESGDKKDMAYFYESDEELNSNGSINKSDKCAEEILMWLNKIHLNEFSKKQIPDTLVSKYPNTTLSTALRDMVTDGVLDHIGRGPSSKYLLTKLVKKTRSNE